MSTCEVCWTAEAVYECRLCRRRVCPAHYVADRGICAVCYENLCEVCHSRLAVDSCVLCGKLVCRNCSRELQPGLRICHECFIHFHEYVKKDARLSYLLRLLESSHRPSGI